MIFSTPDIPAAKAARLTTAFGKMFDLRDTNDAVRQATKAEIEAYINNELKKIVLLQERKDAEDALQHATF